MSEDSLYQCRLCLKDSQFCYSLFDEDVTEIIESFTSIKIYEDDDLPTTCCSQCLEDTYLVYKIRSRIIESDKILRERLVSQTSVKNEQKSGSKQRIVDVDELTMPIKVEINDKPPDEILEPLEDGKFNFTIDEINSGGILEEAAQSDQQTEITINPELNQAYKKQIENKRNESYECEECQLTFSLLKCYHQHMKKHNIISVCKICGTQVLSTNFRRHLEVHKSSPKVCEICGTVAKNAESLRGHMFYMHKSTAEQYKCAHCGKFYRYRYKYHLHLRKAHGGDKSHICEVCGKAFYTARDVKRHIQMTHMKLRPFICEYCNKGFSSAYARRTHVRQHTNEKPFKCEICAEGFRQRVSLKTHLKSKHGIIVQSGERQLHQPIKRDPLEMDEQE